jgi:hypothetical protein
LAVFVTLTGVTITALAVAVAVAQNPAGLENSAATVQAARSVRRAVLLCAWDFETMSFPRLDDQRSLAARFVHFLQS